MSSLKPHIGHQESKLDSKQMNLTVKKTHGVLFVKNIPWIDMGFHDKSQQTRFKMVMKTVPVILKRIYLNRSPNCRVLIFLIRDTLKHLKYYFSFFDTFYSVACISITLSFFENSTKDNFRYKISRLAKILESCRSIDSKYFHMNEKKEIISISSISLNSIGQPKQM